MSDAVNFAELDGQHVELLPARTVLSMFSAQIPIGDAESTTSGGPTSGGGSNVNPMSMLDLTSTSPGAAGTNSDGASGASNS